MAVTARHPRGQQYFVDTGATGLRHWAKPKSILYDVKSVLPVDAVDGRL